MVFLLLFFFFFFQAEDGIRDHCVTGVQTCALPISGVGLFQSNIVYDVERFAEWWTPMVEAGLHERAPLLVGVTPPRSRRMLQFMHDRIPGVEVDDATFARIDGLEGDEAKAVGIEIAVDVVNGVRA